MIEQEFQLGELVWFTFDGAVPRLGVVSAIRTTATDYQILFEKQKYWLPSNHVAKYSG